MVSENCPWLTIKFIKENIRDASTSLNESKNANEPVVKQSLAELTEFIKSQFDSFESLPMDAIIKTAELLCDLTDMPQHLPNFPPQPSKTMLDAFIKHRNIEHLYLSNEQYKRIYQEESDNIPLMVETLKSWKNELSQFISGIDDFKKTSFKFLNANQKAKIESMAGVAQTFVSKINERIEEKEVLLDKSSSYATFYNSMKKDVKFAKMSQTQMDIEIRKIWNKTDETVRRCFAEQKEVKIEEEEVEENIVPPEKPSRKQKQKRKMVEKDESVEEKPLKRGRKVSKTEEVIVPKVEEEEEEDQKSIDLSFAIPKVTTSKSDEEQLSNVIKS